MTYNGKKVKIVKTPAYRLMRALAYNWRLQKGGLIPKTVEDHIRNIHNYCAYAQRLN